MDLVQTRTPELEQDAHDSEGPEDQNRRKTLGRLTVVDTRAKVGQVQANEDNMRETEIFRAALKAYLEKCSRDAGS